MAGQKVAWKGPPEEDTVSLDYSNRKKFKEQVFSYGADTSIHGVKYVLEKERTIGERICWIILMICSLVLCGVLIAPIYDKWQNSPTITVVNSTNYPIWNIDFPAVTICSNNKMVRKQFVKALNTAPFKNGESKTNVTRCMFRQTHVPGQNGSNYTETEHCEVKNDSTGELELVELDQNFTKTRPRFAWAVSDVVKKLVYFAEDLKSTEEFTIEEEYIFSEYKDDLQTLMQNIMHRCEELVIVCTWQGKMKKCVGDDFFQVRRTDNGFCCSFNTIKMDEQFSELEANAELEEDYEEEQTTVKASATAAWGDYDYTTGTYGYYDYYGYGYGYYGYGSYGSYGSYGYYYGSYGSTTTWNWGSSTTTTGGSGGGSGNSGGTTAGATTAGATTAGATTAGATTAGATTAGATTAAATTTAAPTGKRRRKRAAAASADSDLYRSNSASALLGLSVLLYPERSEYNLSMNNYYGFKVLVHSPYSFPEVTGKGFAVGEAKEVFIAVGAQFTQSSTTVLEMDLSKRKCIRHDEDVEQHGIKLEAFDQYSRPSCLLECRAHHLNKTCGCLPYYYPDFMQVWGHDTVCDSKGLRCLATYTAQLQAMSTGGKEGNSTDAIGIDCNCPVDCSEVVYSQEVSQADLRSDSLIFSRLKNEVQLFMSLFDKQNNTEHKLKTAKTSYDAENNYLTDLKECKKRVESSRNFTINPNFTCPDMSTSELKLFLTNKTDLVKALKKKMNSANNSYIRATNDLTEIQSTLSLVHIYFKELGIVQYNRDQLYGIMDVIAAFGGIVGLCMGFSLLSAAELIYYFSIRLFIDCNKEKAAIRRERAAGYPPIA